MEEKKSTDFIISKKLTVPLYRWEKKTTKRRIQYDLWLFCPECHKGSFFISCSDATKEATESSVTENSWTFQQYADEDKFKKKEKEKFWVCPHCKKTHNLHFKTDFWGLPFRVRIELDNQYAYEASSGGFSWNSLIAGWNNETTISIKVVKMTAVAVVRDGIPNLFIKDGIIRYCYKKATHQMYVIRKGKPRLFCIADEFDIINAEDDARLFDWFMKKVNLDTHGYSINTMQSIIRSTRSPIGMVLFIDQYGGVLSAMPNIKWFLRTYSQAFITGKGREWIRKELRMLGVAIETGRLDNYPKYIRKPSVIRVAAKNPETLILHRLFYRWGIKDINVRNELVCCFLKKKRVGTGTFSEKDNMIADVIVMLAPCDTIFFSEVVKNKKAAAIFNMIKELIVENCGWLVHDAGEMYAKVKAAGYTPEIKGNIREIHDGLMRLERRIRKSNREIPYTLKEQKMQGEYNGYSFVLPKDTHTLVDIGEQMNICVGGYDEMAVSKICTIVTAIKDESYKVCIELRGKNICQAKAFCNTYPEGSARLAVLSWASSCGLNIKTNDIDTQENVVKF